SRGKFVHPCELVGQRYEPVHQRSLLKVPDAIGVEGYPIAGLRHLSSGFRVDRIGIVQKRRRVFGSAKVNGRREDAYRYDALALTHPVSPRQALFITNRRSLSPIRYALGIV